MDTSAANTNGDEPQSLSLLFDTSRGDRGILCNDPSGLCLASQGNIDTANAGVFTNLVRLAAQLPDASSSAADSSSKNGGAAAAPLIAIEYESHAYVVKEYDGYAVAVRVPRSQDCGASGSIGSNPSGNLQEANSSDSVDQAT